MEITEKTLPASFELYFAAVEYIFSVYCEFYEGKTCWRYSSNLEPFDYNGHVNILESHAKLLQPIKITRGGSFFKNKRPSVRVTVYKRACLPGETIEGTLEIENPTSETLRDIQVSLVRKIMHADAWTRRLKTWLVVEERLELDDPESRELNWDFSLELPTDLMPTYRRMRHVLDIFYILQVGHIITEFKNLCYAFIYTDGALLSFQLKPNRRISRVTLRSLSGRMEFSRSPRRTSVSQGAQSQLTRTQCQGRACHLPILFSRPDDLRFLQVIKYPSN